MKVEPAMSQSTTHGMAIKGAKFVLGLFFVGLFLGACAPEVSQGCQLPPKGFSEADLIGTWSAIGSQGNNAITIRGDRQYKQIMKVTRTGFSYESDWKPWRITYSDKGLPYLHLEGLLMCAYWSQIDCSTGGTDITPAVIGDTKDPFASEYHWYDDCRKKWVETPDEGVFMVFGTTAYYPRKINLAPFTKSPESPSGPAFALQNP